MRSPLVLLGLEESEPDGRKKVLDVNGAAQSSRLVVGMFVWWERVAISQSAKRGNHSIWQQGEAYEPEDKWL